MPTCLDELSTKESELNEPIPPVHESETESQTKSQGANTEAIARLAYTYWLDGGCKDGTADEDWSRAERQLMAKPEQQTPAVSAGGGE